MSEEVKTNTSTDQPQVVSGPTDVTAALGLINRYPKLALIIAVLLMGGAPNIGKLVFPSKCDPEITKHIEDIKASQADMSENQTKTGNTVQAIKIEQEEAKKAIKAISIKQEVVRDNVSEIRSEQKIIKSSINNIKEDVKENKDDIKSALKK